MQKDGTYAIYLRRENAYNQPYQNGQQAYILTSKQIQFIESYLENEGFDIQTIVGAKKTPKEKRFARYCKNWEEAVDRHVWEKPKY